MLSTSPYTRSTGSGCLKIVTACWGPGNRQKLIDPPRTLGDNPGSLQ